MSVCERKCVGNSLTNKKVKPLNVFISGAEGTQSRILSIIFQGSDKDFQFIIWRTRKGESIKNDCNHLSILD